MTNNNGINGKVRGVVELMLTSAQNLKSALLKRDTTKIWGLLAEQESMMKDFEQYSFLWKELYNGDSVANSTMCDEKNDIIEKIKELKLIGNQNAALSRSFLSAINRATQGLGTKNAKKTKVYGKRGRMQKKSSFMLNKIG